MDTQDQATFEAYDGVVIDLPNGETIKCRCLTWREGVRLLGIWKRARTTGFQDPMNQFLDEFPEAIELPEDVRLTPGELFDLAERFFPHRRTGQAPWIRDPESETEGTETRESRSPTPSTISSPSMPGSTGDFPGPTTPGRSSGASSGASPDSRPGSA